MTVVKMLYALRKRKRALARLCPHDTRRILKTLSTVQENDTRTSQESVSELAFSHLREIPGHFSSIEHNFRELTLSLAGTIPTPTEEGRWPPENKDHER